MAILAPLLPLIGSLATLGLRKRSTRVRWAGSVGLAGLHLLTLVVLIPQLPLESELTTWSPTSLFHGRVILTLDLGAWLLALAAASLFAAQLLLTAGRERMPSPGQIALGFGYLGLATAAFLAGNLLTVALTWAAVDALAYVHLLARSQDVSSVRDRTRGFVLKGASTLVIVAGAIPEAAGGGGPVTQTLEISVLAAAVWLRCGMWPLPRPAVPLQDDSLVAGLDRHLPAAMGIGALVHVLGGTATSGVAGVLVLIGAANVLLGGLQALIGPAGDRKDYLQGWTVAAGGVAMLMMVEPRGAGGLEFAWWGAALIVAGGVSGWLQTPTRRARWLTGLVGLFVVVAPGLAQGGAAVRAAAGELTPLQVSSAAFSIAAAVILGLAALMWPQSKEDRPVDEPFIEGAAAVASLLPPLSLAGAFALIWPARLGPAAAYAIPGLVLLAAGYVTLHRVGVARLAPHLERAAGAFSQVSDRSIRLARVTGNVGLWVLGTLGEVLEGRAALLWVLVVVLALALSTVSG